MKKFLVGLNILLVIAVCILYFLYFSYASNDVHKIKQANAAAINSFKLAYFDLDTLQSKYNDYKEVRDELRSKDSSMTAELNQLRNAYVSKVKEYQQKGSLMTAAEQNEAQQTLAKLQDDYQQRQQEMSQEMNAVSMQKLQDIKLKIQNFLKDYCREKGYAYVFASSNDDNIYYKDTLRNITDDIVTVLNSQSTSSLKK